MRLDKNNFQEIIQFTMANSRKVISVKFNQDQGKIRIFAINISLFNFIKNNAFIGCFTCCMESGLRIYNVEPLVEKSFYG